MAIGSSMESLVCFLSVTSFLGGLCNAFSPSVPIVLQNDRRCRDFPLLNMSYLDSLSPQKPDDNLPDDNPNQQKENQKPKKQWAAPSGGIPSGRGPQASYLDMMTGAAGKDSDSANSEGSKDANNPDDTSPAPRNTKKIGSWSSGYLSEFLSGNDDSRTDVRNLLTQRSIQSFMFLLEQCRDPHSAKWIQEDFLQTGNLLDFHGTGATFIEEFGGSWDASLIEMSQQPKTTIVVSAKRRGRGHGGWSKNNPYLQERWVELSVDVNPASLCERILSVREQIAKEWVGDLDILMKANDMILESYFAKMKTERDLDKGKGEAVSSVGMAFERTAVNLVNDESRFAATASSPLRRGNFDLLYTLCTQAAIHRLLRQYIKAGDEKSTSFTFLKTFYTDRAVDYFDGELVYGRADSFIDELLRSSPSVLTKQDGKTGLVDPIGTAERIILMRNDVATEWKQSMVQVVDDHIRVRQAILSKRMENTQSGNESGRDQSAFQ